MTDFRELQKEHNIKFNNALYRIRKLRRQHLGRSHESIPPELWERTKQFIVNKIKKNNPIRWKELQEIFE